MLNSTVLIAAAAAVVGFVTYWSNPRRAVNAGFFAFSLVVALWLICLNTALQGGPTGQFWLRMTCAVGAFVFMPVWFIKEAILRDGEPVWLMLRRSMGWGLACAVIAVIPWTEWFVARASSRESPGFGTGSYVFIAGFASLYGLLARDAIKQVRAQTGLKRIELQIVLLGASAAALAIIVLMLVRNLTGAQWVPRTYPIIVLVFYTSTVVAITTSRVFNARQILMVGLQKFVLVTVVAVVAFGVDSLLSDLRVGPISWVFTTAAALWAASLLKDWLDRMFEFYPQGKAARQAAFAAAQRERTIADLETAFRGVLTGWGNSERALILSGNKQSLGSGAVQLEGAGPVMRTMRELRWATPERLARERSSPDRQALRDFLTEQQLGVLVIEEGLALTVLVGVGQSASRRPYTYPQVTQLMELGTIIESALERAHFSAKIQHTEQLATVGVLGASLAHEIRNPLVSIKTFVQLLPNHYQDPAFRQKFFRLIIDEVNRIDQLTDQLLDLSAPRAYQATMIDLHPFLLAGLDLVAAKASHRQVELKTDFRAAPDRAFTDASAAKQVMLNLCFNAIQAVEACDEAARWVQITTRNVGDRIEMAVSDGGPGIAPEIRPKLFQPFQTTKSTGFGLGLAVCSDILANLHATISVDPPEPGHGATFRVSFPCQPLSY